MSVIQDTFTIMRNVNIQATRLTNITVSEKKKYFFGLYKVKVFSYSCTMFISHCFFGEPGFREICKSCGPLKQWDVHTAHNRENSLYNCNLPVKPLTIQFCSFDYNIDDLTNSI